VAELAQTRATPFKNGILGTSWWCWFKQRHLEISIHLISKAQGLTPTAYNSFYENLQSLYNKHNYLPNHIWNCVETNIKASRQSGALMLVKKGSQQIYNTIPKSREWMIVNCVVNAARGVLHSFYIFKR
jgi:hypothetical protein